MKTSSWIAAVTAAGLWTGLGAVVSAGAAPPGGEPPAFGANASASFTDAPASFSVDANASFGADADASFGADADASFGRVRVEDGTLAVESCVSDARIAFGREDLRVMLDDDERQAVHAQLMQRYPAAQRVGVEPTHLVLWQQPSGTWIYVALLQHPRQADQWCFTASFVAGGLERTTALLRKYFALGTA
jgi:hypothetical protein